MHEIGPVTATARHLIGTVNGTPVRSVTVALGPGVDQEVAAAAWHEAVRDSALDGAEIDWRAAWHVLACLDCGHEYSGADLDLCPRCGGDGLIVAEAPLVAVTGWAPHPRSGVDGEQGSGLSLD